MFKPKKVAPIIPFRCKTPCFCTWTGATRGLQVQKSSKMHLDRGSEGAPGAKKQQNALGPARPWRRFAETLQTGAIVHSQRPIPGASLQHFCRPAPKTQQTGAKNPADQHQKPSRPAPKTQQTGAKNPADRHQRHNRQSPTTNVTIANHFCQLYQKPVLAF